MRVLFPTRSVAILLAIGIIDLLSTAILHSKGMIVELNPLMAFFITKSEWLFAFVKGLTLGSAWGVMAWYAKFDRAFVGKASAVGALAYGIIWCAWFFGAQ